MDPQTLLVGVGKVYVAPVGTAFPLVDAAPGVAWIDLGPTNGGVTVEVQQKIDEHRTDQETGPVKATRSEESVVITAKLAQATLENIAKILGNTLTDTPPGVGTIGTREVALYRGASVATYAFLFRGESPYGAGFNAQYELPVGYFGEALGQEHTKEGYVVTPFEFHALVDPNAATPSARFGRLVAQDAAALP